MYISKIVDGVEIFDLNPQAYLTNVLTLVHKRRFGDLNLSPDRRSLELGKALLASGDFCRAKSGLSDDSRVFLPVAGLFKSREQIRGRLQFMMDGRGNPLVIRALLAGVACLRRSDAVGGGAKVKDRIAWISHIQLDPLSSRIFNLAKGEGRPVAKGVMRGDFNSARAAARRIECSKLRALARRVIRDMALIWGFFDLQIISAKLFHAEHNSFETGTPDDPTPAVTTATVVSVEDEMLRAGRIAAMLFEKGNKDLTPDEERERDWFYRFAERTGAREVGVREGLRSGFSTTELAGIDDVDPAALRDLRDTLGIGELVAEISLDEFEALARSERATIVDHALAAAEEAATGEAVEPQTRAERNFETAVQRFGMSPVTALCHAVISVVTTVSRLPSDDRLLDPDFDVAASTGDTTRVHQLEAKAIANLIWCYRNLYVRDPYHAPEYDAEEHRRILRDGEKADAQARLIEDDDVRAVIEIPHKYGRSKMDWLMGRGLTPHEKLYRKNHSIRSPKIGLAHARAIMRYKAKGPRAERDKMVEVKASVDERFASSLGWRFGGKFSLR